MILKKIMQTWLPYVNTFGYTRNIDVKRVMCYYIEMSNIAKPDSYHENEDKFKNKFKKLLSLDRVDIVKQVFNMGTGSAEWLLTNGNYVSCDGHLDCKIGYEELCKVFDAEFVNKYWKLLSEKVEVNE